MTCAFKPRPPHLSSPEISCCLWAFLFWLVCKIRVTQLLILQLLALIGSFQHKVRELEPSSSGDQ